MSLPMLDSCCCGCTLKTGTLIIGIFDAIMGTIILITSIVYSDYFKNDSDFYGVFVASAVFSAFYLTMAILLCIGASKERPNLLTPWLIYVLIYIISYIITSIINAVSYFAISDAASGSGMIVSAVITVCLQGYFFLVVYSLYRMLKSPIQGYPQPSYPQPGPNFARGGDV